VVNLDLESCHEDLYKTRTQLHEKHEDFHHQCQEIELVQQTQEKEHYQLKCGIQMSLYKVKAAEGRARCFMPGAQQHSKAERQRALSTYYFVLGAQKEAEWRTPR
jgi:hypothetical protein